MLRTGKLFGAGPMGNTHNVASRAPVQEEAFD